MRDTRNGPVAQLAEQQTLNLLVLGSTPSGLTKFSSGNHTIRYEDRCEFSCLDTLTDTLTSGTRENRIHFRCGVFLQGREDMAIRVQRQ